MNEIGHRRADAFRQVEFDELAGRIHCPTIIMLGGAEAIKYPEMKHRAEMINQKIAGSRFVPIDDVGHDVADERYIKAIQSEI